MPRVADPAKHLEETIVGLQKRRQMLISEVARIDALFERYGIHVEEPRGARRSVGRPAGARTAAAKPVRRGRRRKRGVFAKSAQESIVDFLKGRGEKGATTAEINEHWQSEGRAGSAYVTIGQLVKRKKIKKQNLKGERGSRYWAS
jgi:hypothetical protein